MSLSFWVLVPKGDAGHVRQQHEKLGTRPVKSRPELTMEMVDKFLARSTSPM
jgi:hypothetical protein